MSVLKIVAIVAAAIAGIVGTLALIGTYRLRGLQSAQRRRVADFGDMELTAQANFFGQATAGKDQERGLGTLVLTDQELVFLQLVPEREIRISRQSITSARATRHFLGKTQGRDLLVVTWDVNGMGDAAAFDTPNTPDWIARLS